MKKKISDITPRRARRMLTAVKAVGGLVAAMANAPVKVHVPPPTPTKEQAEVAWKIVCSTANYTELRKVSEALLIRWLGADLNELPASRSGYAYIPGGGAITATSTGSTVWGAG